ncbi:putative tRNA methyltransferase subunit GCD14 [Hortaea werneckii]|nr:putative tRNA methyltransferase subunit GCD14 [Hortaea werneckii]
MAEPMTDLTTSQQAMRTMRPSPFFHTPPTAEPEGLAMLHLKRDALIPVKLLETADDGYAEGAVTNTRFGSFPHSTLIDLEWGSQVRASKVDTGTRGRKGKKSKGVDAAASNGANGSVEGPQKENAVKSNSAGGVTAEEPTNGNKKRSSETAELDEKMTAAKKLKQEAAVSPDSPAPTAPKAAVEAGSGFVHLLQPTPESWTSSLDHRTQVVYTPDYSYILSRLRARPGGSIIEAGAGSGSFTHAAARAVFSGYADPSQPSGARPRREGTVYSYEFHAPRVETLREEISDHGLEGVVHLTHRDVCNQGFTLSDSTSPKAEAIFLDLPAPWQALRHLSRSTPNSPLHPEAPVHICTFSPCIEQVIATVSALRLAGWTEIEMVEVQNRRIDVRREQVGLKNEGLRGVNASAATPDEAIRRLREVEHKLLDFHASKAEQAAEGKSVQNANGDREGRSSSRPKPPSKQERLERIKKEAEERKTYKEGNLVHRTEPEVKTHTSYLVFAVLPQEWSEADEAAADKAWPVEDMLKSAS